MVKKILCIEDNPEMRLGVRMALESVGYEIEEAEDGRKGLNRALEILPDLIICDIKMPGMDGFQTLAELRKHNLTEHIPFIFMTGEDPRIHLRKGMNLGANDFIIKPFTMDELIKSVQTRLELFDRTREESRQAINELSESITRALPHELRTPMTGILGLAELLKSQADEMTPFEVKDLAQLLFDSAVRMNKTLEKFWIHSQCLLLPNDNAKLSASRQTGSKDAEQIIRRVTEDLAGSYNRSGDLVLRLSPLSIAISERYLDQVVRQVVDNAFKFSTTRTTVTVSSTTDNDAGIITVIDNGRGMSRDHIQKIHSFLQFERERYEQQGLGLGLMIAKRLTEIHNGKFHVMSEMGKTTTVTLTFPGLQT